MRPTARSKFCANLTSRRAQREIRMIALEIAFHLFVPTIPEGFVLRQIVAEP
jgi:hypothetical protein